MLEQYTEALTAAATPSAPDLLEARAGVLSVLAAQDSATIDHLVAHQLAQRDVPASAPYNETITVNRAAGDEAVDRDNPTIVRKRVRRAVREALGVLIADGLVMQAAGDGYRPGVDSLPLTVTLGNGSQSGSVSIPDNGPRFSGGSDDSVRWRLVRPASHPVQQLATSNLLEGLEDLLRPRGLQVLDEAVRCFQSGRYLASVDLLAAASEAAWFTLGGAVRDDTKLAGLVAGGERAAQVIEQTKDALQRVKALDASRLHDVRARAAHLRELRNYGLHPIGPHQDEHEAAFTEAGAALLFMGARSYFLVLRDALSALQNPDA